MRPVAFVCIASIRRTEAVRFPFFLFATIEPWAADA